MKWRHLASGAGARLVATAVFAANASCRTAPVTASRNLARDAPSVASAPAANVAAPLSPPPSPTGSAAPAGVSKCRTHSTVAEPQGEGNTTPLRASASPGFTPFADLNFVRGERVDVSLFEGSDDVRLDADVDRVSFVAWTKRDAFLYLPATAPLIDGYFIPFPETEPRWHQRGAAEFHAEFVLPAGLRPASLHAQTRPATLGASLPCDEMTTVMTFEVHASLHAVAAAAGIDDRRYESLHVEKGASVPLSATPHGPPVAWIEPTAPIRLDIYAPLAGSPRARINPAPKDDLYVVWTTDEGLVVGWVPRALFPGGPPGGGGASRGVSTCSMRAVPRPERLRQCVRDVDLFVSQPGQPASLVGIFHEHAFFRFVQMDGDGDAWAEVALETPGYGAYLRETAKLLIRGNDLAACPEITVTR